MKNDGGIRGREEESGGKKEKKEKRMEYRIGGKWR